MLRYAALNYELKHVVEKCYSKGEKIILDYARENVPISKISEIKKITEASLECLSRDDMIAVKLSSFGVKENPLVTENTLDEIIDKAKSKNIRVCIDAEEILYPDICNRLNMRHNSKYQAHVYTTYQMYRRNTMDELLWDIGNAYKNDSILGVKLVRGAYLKTQQGVFTSKADTDHAYNKGLAYALNCPKLHTIVATHNLSSIRYAKKFPKNRYVFAKLLGFGSNVSKVDYRYIPFGTFAELTPYLLRRLSERMTWS